MNKQCTYTNNTVLFTDTSDEKPEKCGICEQITKELQYDYEEKEFMCRICIQEKEEFRFCYICSRDNMLQYDPEEEGFICATCVLEGEELHFCYICSRDTEDLQYDPEEQGFICATCVLEGEEDMQEHQLYGFSHDSEDDEYTNETDIEE